MATELAAKQVEYDRLKQAYDEYIETSKEIEKELEDSLAQSEKIIAELKNKKLTLEAQISATRKEENGLQDEIKKIKNRLNVVENEKLQLELRNEGLADKVRILEATEEDLKVSIHYIAISFVSYSTKMTISISWS